MGHAVVVEAALPQALLAQPVDVDVDERLAGAGGEALGLAEEVAPFVDHRLAVPRQVGGGLPFARGGVEVGGIAARRGGAGEQVPVLRAGDGDGGGRQVEQDGRAGQGGLGARRHRHPHVLADLGMDDQARHVVDVDEQVGAEGDAVEHFSVLALGEGRPEPLVDDARAGGEVPLLVELAVVGQVGLRGDADDLAAVDQDRAVVEAVAMAKGGAHHDEGQQVGGASGELDERGLDLAQQHVLQEQVVDGVAGDAELGEERDRRPLPTDVAGPLEAVSYTHLTLPTILLV